MYVSQTKTRYHRVRNGDTLSYLARRYGTTVSELKRTNQLISTRFIHVGQIIVIPQ